MNSLRALLTAALATAFAGTAYGDVTVVHTDNLELNIGGMAQVLGIAEKVDDPYKNDERAYLFFQVARLRLNGHYDRVRFNLELGLGAEDLVVAPNPGVSLGLLDLSFEIPVGAGDMTYFKVGQFKVPYGREQLAYEGDLQYDNRSIENLGFVVGRDVGVALVTQPRPFILIGGVFTGGGRDVPTAHELPEDLGFPLFVVRAGVGNVDDDPFVLTQSQEKVDHPRVGFFVNGLITKDSKVGHSTVLNVKLADKSLLLDSNWNPFIARAPFSQGTWWQTGADAVLRMPLGSWAFNAEIEGDYGEYSNDYGTVHLAGGRSQVGFRYNSFEAGARYAVLFPDSKFANGGVPFTGTEPIHELTPVATYYIKGENLKLVADAPIILNDVVFIEKGVGDYVATDMPDQSSVLATGGTFERQTVYQARLMFQGRF